MAWATGPRVAPEAIRTLTSGLEIHRSIQLSYGNEKFSREADLAWTDRIDKLALAAAFTQLDPWVEGRSAVTNHITRSLAQRVWVHFVDAGHAELAGHAGEGVVGGGFADLAVDLNEDGVTRAEESSAHEGGAAA